MQTQCSADVFGFALVERRAVVAGFDGGRMPSDAGELLVAATDRAIGLVERFAACFSDGRAVALIEHEVKTLVGKRIFGIALGYEDLVDHDQLRHDPTLAVLGRQAGGAAQGLCDAGRQIDAQPAGAGWIGAKPLPPHRLGWRQDRSVVS